MSKSLTVRLTLRRSSARSAPISYTPPVKPPPPSTSAVRERRGLRRFGLATVLRSFWEGFSSRTTSPMRDQYDRSGAPASVFSALDAPYLPALRRPPRPASGRRGRAGPRPDGQAAHRPDALCGGLFQRIRGEREPREAAGRLPLAR